MDKIKNSIDLYMEERVEEQLNWYSTKATSNKRWYCSLVVTSIVLSAFIPFITIYYDVFEETKYIIALVATIITIISGISSTFQYQKKWIEYRTTVETIKHEKFLFLNMISPYHLNNRNAILIKNIEALISKQNTNWSYYIQNSNNECEKEEENQ